MKKPIIAFLAILLSSCATTEDYYQVYKTSTENGTITRNKIVFEDQNCRISYNLWADGGNIGFSIYNKTENDITVNLNKSFFVLNGEAFEYFQNITTTSTTSTGGSITTYPYRSLNNTVSSVSGSSSSSTSITFIEKPELTIPSKTSVNVPSSFAWYNNIGSRRYLLCDWPKYPSKKEIVTLKFDKTNSPYVFSNLITYSTKDDTTRLENKFHVTEITNYPSEEMLVKVDTNKCGGKLDFPTDVFKSGTPEQFYIKYTYVPQW